MLLLLAFAAAPPLPEPLPEGAVARLGSPRYASSRPASNLSLSADGERVILAGTSVGMTFDRRSGAVLARRRFGPSDRSRLNDEEYGLSSVPGGRYFAAGGFGSVSVWERGEGKPKWQFGSRPIARVALHPKETEVAALDQHGLIRVWDLTAGKLRWQADAHLGDRLRPPEGPRLALVYDRDGGWLASGGRQGEVRLWSPDGKPGRVIRRGGPDVGALEAGPGGTLAAGFADGTVAVYDAASGKELRRWSVSALPVSALRFTPDGRELIACGAGATRFTRWDPATGRPIDPVDGHAAPPLALAYRPDGRLVSVSLDRQVIEWREGRPTARSLPRHGGETEPNRPLYRAKISLDGSVVAVTDTNRGAFRLFDTATGEPLRGLESVGDWSQLALDGSGRRLFVREAGRVEGWDVSSRKLLWTVSGPKPQMLAASPDGRRLLVTMRNVELRDGNSGELLRALGPVVNGGDPLFSPDGRTVAIPGNGVLRLWDTHTGRALVVPVRGNVPHPQAFSPDGRLLAATTADEVWLVESATGRRAAALRCPGVSHLAFAPDGRTFATAAGDGEILLWDVGHRAAAGDAARLWDDLESEDAARAWRAVWSVARTPEAEAFLARKLAPVRPLPAALLDRLDHEDFAVRDAAQRELFGSSHGVLRASLAGEKRLEVRKRLQRVLDGATRPLREGRALAALERAGAAALLQRLAAGAAGAELTDEARAALRRMRR